MPTEGNVAIPYITAISHGLTLLNSGILRCVPVTNLLLLEISFPCASIPPSHLKGHFCMYI